MLQLLLIDTEIAGILCQPLRIMIGISISVTTVDGQHFSNGDADKQFCIQSCSKPLSYLIALNEFGEEYVHSSVGTEPSGRAFNEMTLKSVPLKDDPGHAIPHNPMINAGAIMSVSMVYPDLNRVKRLEKVLDFWKQLSAGAAAKEPVGSMTTRTAASPQPLIATGA